MTSTLTFRTCHYHPAARQVLRHPREVAEATAVTQLQERYASLIKFATPARPVYKTVPVHGKVKYFPPGWRLRFRHQELRYISATDVSGAFAAKLGLGTNIKPLETVVDGRVADKQQKVDAKKGDIRKVDPVEPESSGDEPESDSDDSEAERELDFLILRNMKTEALRDLCRTAGLPDSGSKAVLISLLMNPEEADAEPRPKKRKKEEKEKREKRDKKEKKEKREKKEMKEMKVKKDKQPKTPEEPKTSKESSGALSGAFSGAFCPTEEPEDELARLEAFLATQDPSSSSHPKTVPREAHERAEMEARMEQEQKEKAEEEARAKEALAAKKDLGVV